MSQSLSFLKQRKIKSSNPHRKKLLKNEGLYNVEYIGDVVRKTLKPIVRTKVLSDSLKTEANQKQFKRLIEQAKKRMPHHVGTAITIEPCGNYTMKFVDGYNLQDLYYEEHAREKLFKDKQCTIEQVLVAINDFAREFDTNALENEGDWALHNLIYDRNSKHIVNVDLEGFYTYSKNGLKSVNSSKNIQLQWLKSLEDVLESAAKRYRNVQDVRNLISHAVKQTQVCYNGGDYSNGYHAFYLDGQLIHKGQRDIARRFEFLQPHLKLTGKTILDIGCNQGGMCFYATQTLGAKSAVGVDYNSKLINVCQRTRAISAKQNTNFYTFDLVNEPLYLLKSFLPIELMNEQQQKHVDVVFLLSMCMWLDNWRDVLKFVASVTNTLVIETNGTPKQQNDQIEFVKTLFKDIVCAAESSEDDPGQKKRKLYVAKK